MGLFIALVVILAIQHGLTQDINSVPRLRYNKLDEETDIKPSIGDDNNCGSELFQGGRVISLTLSEALTSDNLKKRPFTTALIARPEALTNEARFKVARIKTRKSLFALRVDPEGEKAYWLHQSVDNEEPLPFLDVPQHPTADQPKYVFTGDFSRCSWTVTPLDHGFLRLRHVSGLHQARQFNNLPLEQKGGPVSYAMQYKDYGATARKEYLADNSHSFAYMHYSEGKWTLHLQLKACRPVIGAQDSSIPTSFIYYISTKDYIIPN